MGQKTNPTALRLEKTNQHYTSSWYSERFYPQQLHNNYKTSNYIAKIFHKIIKVPYLNVGRGQQQQIITTKPLIYTKASYQTNQIFCVFPKFRNKYYWRRENKKNKGELSRQLESTGHLAVFSMLCALAAYKCKVVNKSSICVTFNTFKVSQSKQVASSLISPAPTENLTNNKSATNFVPFGTSRFALPLSFLEGEQKHNKPLLNQDQLENLSPLVRALFYKHSFSCHRQQVKQAAEGRVNTYNPPRGENNHLSRLENIMEGDYHLSFAQKHNPEAYLRSLESGRVSALALPSSPGGPVEKCHRKASKHKHLGSTEGLYPAGQTNFSALTAGKKVRLYLVKAGFAQQNSQFLAQRISNGLRNRFTFPRLRRQILWDIRKSKYVKGVRVTLSGRVESRSKKAQKARSRTFQWGQTELHVLSSLVQFTTQNLITPRGKIGIKVWICYGA